VKRRLLAAALAVEARKTCASRVVLVTTPLLVVGIALLAGSLTWAATEGNERVLAQLGDLATEDGWTRFLGVVAQITSAGGLLGFGVVLSWMVGREFDEGTVANLFALPVSRSTTALAKFLVFVVWTATVSAALVSVTAALGLALHLGSIGTEETIDALMRQLALTILTAFVAFPAAWASTLGRGLLPGIATTILLVVVAQVVVIAGAGAWFPVAAPALWALTPSTVSVAHLALVLVVPIAFGLLTTRLWSRLQLDR